jgi:hypothetical protein
MIKKNKFKVGVINKPKKAQITIFIILALAIVLVVLLLFVGRNNLITILGGKEPVEQIKDCITTPLEEAIETISDQGGSLEPENYYLYRGNRLTYLCYTESTYGKCVMQKPLLKQSIEKELEEYIEPRVKSCIEGVKSSFRDKGYIVDSKEPEIDLSLMLNSFILKINADLRFEKDKVEVYESINIDINSRLYDLIMVAGSISNWEARYGESESLLYMGYYPQLKVEKKKQFDGTTIYMLTQRNTLDTFKFAIRSVVIPTGLE